MNGGTPAAVELHLRIRVAPEQQAEFVAFLREAIPYYEAPGGIVVSLLRNTKDTDRFVERISYATRQVWEQDDKRTREDEQMKAYLTRWRSLLAEPPVVEVYEIVRDDGG